MLSSSQAVKFKINQIILKRTQYLKEQYVSRCVDEMDTKTLYHLSSDLLLAQLDDMTLEELTQRINEHGWEDLLEEEE